MSFFQPPSLNTLGAVPTRTLGEYLQAGLVSNCTETLPFGNTYKESCQALFLRRERSDGAQHLTNEGYYKISSPQSSTAEGAGNTSSCWRLSSICLTQTAFALGANSRSSKQIAMASYCGVV